MVQSTGGSSIRYHVESKIATATAEVIHAITPAPVASPLSAGLKMPAPINLSKSATAFVPPPIDAFATHGKAKSVPQTPGIELPDAFRRPAPAPTPKPTPLPAVVEASTNVYEKPRSNRMPIALALAFLLVFALGVWVALAMGGGRSVAAPIVVEQPK